MLIPEGMTEKEVTDQITVVVDRIAPKYTFYGYTANDLKQEAFIICMEALDRYDTSRPLENFLSVNLSNRLKNFVRDNYFSSFNEAKANIIQPAQLRMEDTLLSNENHTLSNRLDCQEMADIIDNEIDPSFRMDYLKLLNDVYLPKHRRNEVMTVVYSILRSHGYDVGVYNEEG